MLLTRSYRQNPQGRLNGLEGRLITSPAARSSRLPTQSEVHGPIPHRLLRQVVKERSENTDEYGRAILMDVARGHIKFFELEGLQVDRLKFLQECGLMPASL